MRKIKSVLIIALTVIMLMSLSLFVACQPKPSTGDETYTLTFNTDGGNELQAMSAKKDESVTLPTPTKDGYVFDGWFTNAEKTEKVLSNSFVVKENTTLYAGWVEGVTVTLDPKGGKLDTTKVTVKKGDKISDSLSKLIPTLEHHEFDAWLDGGKKLSSGKLATEAITLVASYKVEVSVQVYAQKADLSGYELLLTKTVYATENTQYELNETVEGYKLAQNADAVTKITVNADYTKNVLKAYFDLRDYSISFNSNYPVEDLEDEVVTQDKVLYGTTVDAVDTFTCDGYLLIGYATAPDGEVVYPVSGFKKNLYNAEPEDVAPTKVTVEKNLMLYGVWAKGYIDMFGGQDSVFFFEEDGKNEVYVSRGGLFFKGEYNNDSKDKRFEVKDKDGDVLLHGKLLENNTFCYRETNPEQSVKHLFVTGMGLDTNTTMIIENYDEITLTKKGEDGLEKERSTGYFRYNEESEDYIATFDEGDKKGETFHFQLGYDGTTGKGAFRIRDEKVATLGVINRYAVFGTSFAQLKYFQAIFNGYGQVAINQGNQVAAYYVITDEATGVMAFVDNYSKLQGYYKIVEIDGKKVYVEYNQTFDRTVDVRPGEGATLTMDGIGNATYKNGATTVTGVYTQAQSYMGGYIITFANADTTMKFMTGTETVQVGATTDADGNPVEAHEEQKPIVNALDTNYAEYAYLYSDRKPYYHPLIVMNDAEKATVYVYDGLTRTFAVAMTGSYKLDETTGKYTFTVEEYKDTGITVNTLPIELSTVKSFVFGVDTKLTNYAVNYWYAVTDKEDVTTSYEVKYTCADDKDNSTITVVNNTIAIYENNSNKQYTFISTDTKTKRTVLETPQGVILIVDLNEETKTFTKYQYAPHNITLVDEFGNANKNQYIALDGKGGAVLTYVTDEKDENGKAILEEYPGTFTETEETTAFGSKISTFTATDATSGKNLRLIVVQSQGKYYAYVERDTYLKEYRSESDGMLKLDGFGNMANYTTSDGKSYNGIYNVKAENQIVFGVVYQGQIIYYYYIDIKGETFTVKGYEYGAYVVVDNGYIEDIMIELDGYGKAKLFTAEEVTDETTGETTTERKYIDENATYEIADDGEVAITYKDGETQAKYTGKLGTISQKYRAFFKLHEEVVYTYVDGSDFTVMTIDDVGNAVIYDKLGVAQTGTIQIINDNLLYYANSAQTDATLYRYDLTNKTVKQIVYKERFAYYTQDLESLLFTEYGFAIFNGETRYFYEKTEETVYVYHQDPTNAEANKYGFVKQDFGKFGDEKTWEDETYYYNDGFRIVFDRKAETANNYPVNKKDFTSLTFSPAGTDEFTVRGTINYAGADQNCDITRELDENGGYKTYVTYQGYRLYITFVYNGDNIDGSNTKDNQYEIVGMTNEYEAKSVLYMGSMDYLLSVMFGLPLPENKVGNIKAVTTYNEAGEVASNKIDAEFLEDSNLYDKNKNLISMKEKDFTWANGSTIAVEYLASDGDTYMLYLQLSANEYTGELQYAVYAFNRVQELTVGDYKAKLERVLYSEARITAGELFSLKLFDKEGNEIKFEDGLYYGEDRNTLVGFVRTYNDNKMCLTSTLYTIKLKGKEDGTVTPTEPTTPTEGEGSGTTTETETIPALAVSNYESIEVTTEQLKVYNKFQDETVWVEMNSEGEIVCLVPNVTLRKYIMPKNVSYDETTKTYTVTISEKTVYTVEIEQKEDGKDYAVVTKK